MKLLTHYLASILLIFCARVIGKGEANKTTDIQLSELASGGHERLQEEATRFEVF